MRIKTHLNNLNCCCFEQEQELVIAELQLVSPIISISDTEPLNIWYWCAEVR